MNPLHVDPERSAMFGFPTPILHGLCSLGYTARSLQQQYFKNNPEALKELTVRFTSPVIPGQTLSVNSWKDGDTIVFVTKVKETGKPSVMGYAKVNPSAKL